MVATRHSRDSTADAVMRVRTLVAGLQQVTGSLAAPDASPAMPGKIWSKEPALPACSNRPGLAPVGARRS